MAISLSANNVETSFTATADCLIQSAGNNTIEFQTNNAEIVWGKLHAGMTLEVPNGTTIYFKSSFAVDLAVIEF